MSPPEAVGSVLRQYAGFSGRAPRSELWWWLLVCGVLALVAGTIDLAVALVIGFSPVNLLLALALLLPTLAVTVRRLHDSGLAGWWVVLLCGLGLVSGVVLVVGLVTLVVGALRSAGPGDGAGGATITGGLVLLGVAAVVGLGSAVAWLVMMLRPSAPAANRYGPPHGAAALQRWAPPAPPYGPDDTQPFGRTSA